MNYLAHIYLSGDFEDVKIGNFIADFVPGRAYLNYPENIMKGILLHRKIDTYTDRHQIFRQSKKRLFKPFRHYSAVIVDMFYDHFLAKNFSKYSDESLKDYVNTFYELMLKNQHRLPPEVRKILPVMMEYNWLQSYENLDKLKVILKQMNNRTRHNTSLDDSIYYLKDDYRLYEQEFFLFFEDILKQKASMFKSLKIE